jgi:hypothetical protein
MTLVHIPLTIPSIYASWTKVKEKKKWKKKNESGMESNVEFGILKGKKMKNEKKKKKKKKPWEIFAEKILPRTDRRHMTLLCELFLESRSHESAQTCAAAPSEAPGTWQQTPWRWFHSKKKMQI